MMRRSSIVSGVVVDAHDIDTSTPGEWSLTLAATIYRAYPGSGGWDSPDDDSEETYTVSVSGMWGVDGEAIAWDHGMWSGGDDPALHDISITAEAEEAMARRELGEQESIVESITAAVVFVALLMTAVML